MRRKLTASIGFSHVLLDFDSWISKLKLLSRVMASLTHIEGRTSDPKTADVFNMRDDRP